MINSLPYPLPDQILGLLPPLSINQNEKYICSRSHLVPRTESGKTYVLIPLPYEFLV